MAGNGSQVGSAHVAIFPTMSGFRSAVNKEVKAAGDSATSTFSKAFKGAGQKSGAQLGRELKAAFQASSTSMADQVLSTFRKDVASAESAVSSARRKMEDDAGRLRVDEERLQEVKGRDNATSSQLAAAEERVASAQRRSEASAASYRAATERLTAAKSAQAKAEEQVRKATEGSSSSLSRLASAMTGPARSAVSGFSSAWKSATSEVSSSTGVFHTVGSAVSGAVSGLTARVTSGLSGVSSRVGSIFSSIGTTAGNAFSRLPTIVTGTVSEGFSGIGKVVKSVGSTLRSGASAACDGVKKAFSSMASGVQSAMSAMGKAVAVGAAALGVAMVGVGKSALDAYADYEQLVGGVDTLFKDSSAQVQAYAAQAYQTAGISANSYMSQITSFSASLISSLGGDTAAAAEMGNTAIMDMSDNANKMGTDIETIQQTYQSLARGNYAMLDNLKLGYGGTKSEMERMIADANRVKAANGEMADLSVDSFADVVEAIHIIQGEMGITGTTALEASTTITGSVNAAKAAWSNWLAELGKENADMQAVTTQLVDAVAVAAGNVVPRVITIVQTLFTFITTNATTWLQTELPKLLGQFQAWVTGSLPALIQQGSSMLLGVVQGIVDNLPQITSAAVQLLTTLIDGLANQMPQLIPLAMQMVLNVVQGIINNLPQIIDSGIRLIQSLVQGILNALPQLIAQAPSMIGQLVSGIVSNLPKIINAGIDILQSLASGIVSAVPQLIGQIPSIISQIISSFASGDWGSIGSNIISGICEGISGATGWLWDTITSALGGLVDEALDFLGIHSPSTVMRDRVGQWIPRGIGVGIEKGEPSLLRKARGMSEDLVRTVEGTAASVQFGVSGPSSGASRPTGGIVQNFTFNQPIKSPADVAREVRLAERYGLAASA